MSALDRLARSHDLFGSLLRDLGDDDWTAGTPCDGWDVEAVVRHLVTGNRAFTRQLTQGGYVLADVHAEVLEVPRVALLPTYDETGTELATALAVPGVLETDHPTPVGTMSGEAICDLRSLEQVVHAWDLASGLGRTLVIDAEVVEPLVAFVPRLVAGLPSGRTPFAPPRPVAADAAPLDRLLAAVGR